MSKDIKPIRHFTNSVFEGYIKLLEREGKHGQLEHICQSLQISPEWILKKDAWHTIEFHEEFVKAVCTSLGGGLDLAETALESLYTQSGMQRFTSLAGLLLSPSQVFSRLPGAVKRMNLYNEYEYEERKKGLSLTTGHLKQTYLHPDRADLNHILCYSARGSIQGIAASLGFPLLSLEERKCVSKGDDCCQYEATWVNRPFWKTSAVGVSAFVVTLGLLHLLFPPLNFIAYFGSVCFGFSFAFYHWYRKHRRRLYDVFDFQQETLQMLRESSELNTHLNEELIAYQKQLSETVRLATIAEKSMVVAHDIGTPLMVLDAYTKRLDQYFNDDANSEANSRNRILTATNAISRATKHVGSLAKILKATVKTEMTHIPVQLDLVSLLKDQVELFRSFTDQYEIDIKFSTNMERCEIEAYDGHMESVVMNLMQNSVNALKEVDMGRVLLVRLVDLGEMIQFAIRDNGRGIPEERKNNLWQKFGASRSIQSGGMGYGLHAIRQAIEAMGGEIECESSSSGTVFHVKLHRKLPVPKVEEDQLTSS